MLHPHSPSSAAVCGSKSPSNPTTETEVPTSATVSMLRYVADQLERGTASLDATVEFVVGWVNDLRPETLKPAVQRWADGEARWIHRHKTLLQCIQRNPDLAEVVGLAAVLYLYGAAPSDPSAQEPNGWPGDLRALLDYARELVGIQEGIAQFWDEKVTAAAVEHPNLAQFANHVATFARARRELAPQLVEQLRAKEAA